MLTLAPITTGRERAFQTQNKMKKYISPTIRTLDLHLEENSVLCLSNLKIDNTRSGNEQRSSHLFYYDWEEEEE